MEFEFEIEGIGKRIDVTALVEQSQSLRTVRTLLESRYGREQADPSAAHLAEARQRAQEDVEHLTRAGLEDLKAGFISDRFKAINEVVSIQLKLRTLALAAGETGNYVAFEHELETLNLEQERYLTTLRESAPADTGPTTQAARDRLLDRLATRPRRPPPPPTDPVVKADLAEAHKLTYPTHEEVDADLAEMRRRERATGRPKQSRPLRQRLKKLLRERYQGYVHIKTLRANVRAIRALRTKMVAANPDVILSVERGGWFLTDVLTRNEPGLAAKVERIGKLTDKAELYKRIKNAVEVMITSPRRPRRIVVVDAYMGGFNAEALIDSVFQPMLDRYGGEMPDLEFGTYWMREASGFEEQSGGLREAKYHGRGPHANRMAAESETVPWIFGDDVPLIVDEASGAPLNVFDSSGDVIATIPTEGGETTYTLATRVLNGEGLDDLPEE